MELGLWKPDIYYIPLHFLASYDNKNVFVWCVGDLLFMKSV